MNRGKPKPKEKSTIQANSYSTTSWTSIYDNALRRSTTLIRKGRLTDNREELFRIFNLYKQRRHNMTLLSETKIEYYYKTATGAVPKFTFPFSNREEYVKWRTEWRSKYADLSKEIRTNKQKRRDAALELKNIDISEHWNTAHAELQRCLAELKNRARSMMEMRMAAKIYSIQLKNITLKKVA